MRISHNHMCVNGHKELLHVDFHHLLELEGKSTVLEADQFLGIQSEERQFMKQRINRA